MLLFENNSGEEQVLVEESRRRDKGCINIYYKTFLTFRHDKLERLSLKILRRPSLIFEGGPKGTGCSTRARSSSTDKAEKYSSAKRSSLSCQSDNAD
jgi:hypothetical protein